MLPLSSPRPHHHAALAVSVPILCVRPNLFAHPPFLGNANSTHFQMLLQLVTAKTTLAKYSWYGSPLMGILYSTGVLLLIGLLVYCQTMRLLEKRAQHRKDAEELIHKQQLARDQQQTSSELALFSQFMNHWNGAFIKADSAGMVLSAQGNLLQKLGFSADELVGKHQLSIFDMSIQRDILRSVQNGDESTKKYCCEVQIRRPIDGELHWVKVCGAQVVNDHRSIYMTTVLDINHEVQMRERNESLLKLQAVRGACGDVARDYEEILHTIGIYSDLIDDESLRVSIQKANQDATRLTNCLIDFARDDVHEDRLVDVNGFMTALRPMINKLVPGSVQLRFDVDVGAATKLRIDPSVLQRIFINLVTNSLQAINENGSIMIRMTKTEVYERQARALNIFPGNFVQIEVIDDGEGMAPDVLQCAFNPFFTTQKGAGRGIGLTTLKDTVVKTGGAIEISSTVGTGTTVSVFLPEQDHVSSNSDFMEPLAGTFQRKPLELRQSIMIVGPRNALQIATESEMQNLGYSTRCEETPQSMFNALEKSNSADILLVETPLQDYSAQQLYDEIRAVAPRQKIILISKEREIQDSGGTPGASDRHLRHVRKPFLINKIIRAIEDLSDPSYKADDLPKKPNISKNKSNSWKRS